MKKEILLLVIIASITFISGYFVGRGGSERYMILDKQFTTAGIAVFDRQTGTIYFTSSKGNKKIEVVKTVEDAVKEKSIK